MSAPPISSGRASSRGSSADRRHRRPSASSGERVDRRPARPERHDPALGPGGRREAHRDRRLGEPRREPLLEPERRVDADEVAAEAVGGARAAGSSAPAPASRSPRAAASRTGARQERVEIEVGQQGLGARGVPSIRLIDRAPTRRRRDRGRRPAARGGRGPGPRPRSGPRTPAISAVDISSTKRRISAWRRSAGRRPTARHAAAASSRGATSPSTSSGSATSAAASSGASGWRRRERRWFDDGVPGDLEQPDAEGRGAFAVGRPGALLEPGQAGEGGEERPLGGVLGLVMVAELVVRVAVHLGEIPAIQGVEPERIAPGLLDERAIAIEVGDRARSARRRPRPLGRRAHSSQHRSGHRVTPSPRGGRGRTSPTRTVAARPAGRVARRRGRRCLGVDADRADERRRRRRALELDGPAGRQLPIGPVAGVEACRPERRRRAARAARGTRRAAVRGRSGARRRASRSDVIDAASSGGKRVRGPVGVDADPDDGPRLAGPEARRSRRERRPACGRAPSSPSTTRSFGHFRRIVPARQPGHALGRRRPSRGSRWRRAARRGPARARSGRKPSESEQRRRRPAPTTSGRCGRARRSARRRPPGRPPARRPPARPGRRRSSSRRARSARAGDRSAVATVTGSPAGARRRRRRLPSPGRSSSNAAWSAWTAGLEGVLGDDRS